MGAWASFVRGWTRVATAIGDFQGRVILTLLYFTLLVPFALIAKLMDPLRLRKGPAPTWHPRWEGEGSPLDRARRMF